MSKDKYNRTNVHSDLLAKVIFRVDVAGLTDLTGYINRVKGLDLIKKSFNRILPLKSRSVSFVIDAQNSENSKFTQNSEIDNGFRFLDCTIEEGSKAVLDIVNDSIVVSIDCSGAYSGSRHYTALISQLLEEMFEYDKFVSIRRLGIRKIDKKDFQKEEDIFDVFEGDINLFYRLRDNTLVKNRKYYDLLEKNNIRYNYNQQFNRYINSDKIGVIIDLDAYIADEFFRMDELRDLKTLNTLLNENIQDEMFEIFKSCVTEEYLEKCYNSLIPQLFQ